MPRGLGSEGASPRGPTCQPSPRAAERDQIPAAPEYGQHRGGWARGLQKTHLHQEAEGPASLVLQNPELHASCKDSKVRSEAHRALGRQSPGFLLRVPAGAGHEGQEGTQKAVGGLGRTRGSPPPTPPPTFPSASLSWLPGRYQSCAQLHQKTEAVCLGGGEEPAGHQGHRLHCFPSGMWLFPQSGQGTWWGVAALLASTCLCEGPTWEPTAPLT